VTNPTVRNGAVIFTTLIPDSSPCGAGGSSWLMELEVLDGTRLEEPPFDLNGDGEFDNRDNPTVTLSNGTRVTVPISGLTGGTSQGIQSAPGILQGERAPGKPIEYKYLTGTGGRIQIIDENPRRGGTGRQSWRQVR
jgi:type IV pilus assembly protein PilY1